MVEQNREIAFHEAGHAVVAVVRGRHVRGVSIEDDAGSCLTGDADAVVCLAGPLAQARAMAVDFEDAATSPLVARTMREAQELLRAQHGNEESGHIEREANEALVFDEGGRQDLEDAERIAGELEEAMAIARMLVDRHWDAIEGVATELTARGSLAGPEVELLVFSSESARDLDTSRLEA